MGLKCSGALLTNEAWQRLQAQNNSIYEKTHGISRIIIFHASGHFGAVPQMAELTSSTLANSLPESSLSAACCKTLLSQDLNSRQYQNGSAEQEDAAAVTHRKPGELMYHHSTWCIQFTVSSPLNNSVQLRKSRQEIIVPLVHPRFVSNTQKHAYICYSTVLPPQYFVTCNSQSVGSQWKEYLCCYASRFKWELAVIQEGN